VDACFFYFNYIELITLASLGMEDCMLICCFIQIIKLASYACFDFVVLHRCTQRKKRSLKYKSNGADRCYHRNSNLV
jgi:hypothetical protein